MDWASSQWKEGLSSIALQKINALEEKIEKLQKERQQKQLQFDCLELTLNKEKRKVEEEKQQTVQFERELQSLSDVCKVFESKHQKLLVDIQNRDSRINNLEGQLSQAKKQNSRLQQLENDIEELRCLKESAKLENKQLEERLMKEHNTITKQTDAISDLEQTVKSLQEKCSSENSVFLNEDDKENVNILNISKKDSLSSEPLRKKILEQENTIKSLQEQLTRISGSKEKMLPPVNDSFSTPAKGRTTSSEAPVSSAKKSFSYWDNFGSTPAKSGKLVKHVNDSSSFDNDSDGKVHSLQLKLKQMCQELECQRHNFEATKNVMEQRFKEKENTLKAEVKQQAQTIFDMDKELKELRNKYQQDVVQANKKLDVVNMQLQKSELSKQQMEKDMKALENQISSRNSSLQQKEEELKDILKVKNGLEASTKSLQSEKRELEKNNSALTSQKNSLSEEVRNLKMQLDGSNNLVKEKESVIYNLKKEQNSSMKIKSDLENKINSMNKDLSVIQSEKGVLEKQLQELQAEISVLKNNIENVKEEKKNVCSILDLEKSKSEKLKCDLENKEKEIVTFQSEIKSNEHNIVSLKTELEQLTSDYNNKINSMNKDLSVIQSEKDVLEKQLQELQAEISVLKNNTESVKEEKKNVCSILDLEKSKSEKLKCDLENKEKEIVTLQSEIKSNEHNVASLKTELEQLTSDYNVKFKDMEQKLSERAEENSCLKNEVQTYSDNKKSLEGNMAELRKENDRISDLFNSKENESETLRKNIEHLESQLQSVQSDSDAKNENICCLEEKVKSITEAYDKQLNDLKDAMCLLNSEKTGLETLLKDQGIKEESLKATILKMETEKQNLLDLQTSEKEKTKDLDDELSELKKTMENVQMELSNKDVKISDMKETLSIIKSEKSALENNLKNFSDREETLQKSLLLIEADKQNLSDLLNEEKVKSETLQLSVIELEKKISDQHIEIKVKNSSINDLNKHIEELKKRICEMNETVSSIKSETVLLQNNLKACAVSEESLQKKLSECEREKQRLSELLNAQVEKSKAYEMSISEFERKIDNLQTELDAKDSTISDLSRNIEEFKQKTSKIEECITAIKEEKLCLEKDLKDNADKEKSLEKKVVLLEAEKQEFLDLLKEAKKESDNLQSNLEKSKEKIDDLQTEINGKDRTINNLNKTINEFKAKTYEISGNIDVIQSEKSSLEKNLEDCVRREEELQKSLQQTEADKQNLVELLTAEQKQVKMLQLEVTELKNKVDNLQDHLKTKDLAISDLTQSIEEHKVKSSEMKENVAAMKSEKMCLENSLKDCILQEESLQNDLQVIELDKQKLSDLLTAEKERSEVLQLQVTELTKKVDDQQVDLDIKETTINDQNKSIEELKIKVCGLTEDIASIKSEKVTVERELNDILLKVELLQKNMLQIDNEKENLSEQLNAEKSKNEMLELNLTETKLKVDTFHVELDSKDVNIELLNKKLEEFKNYKDHIQEFESQLTVSHEKEMSQNEKIRQLEKERLVTFESLSTEKNKNLVLEANISEFQATVENLESELKSTNETFSSFTSDLANSKENYELKLKKFETTLEAMKSENDNLSNQLKDFIEKEDTLKAMIETMEVEKKNMSDILSSETKRVEDLQINIEVLRANMLTSDSEICQKDGDISNLKTEMEAFREAYEEEKHSLTIYIEDVKCNLMSMQDCLKSIYLDNELIQSEMRNLKEEYQELQIQKTCDQQSRGKFLIGLLNQLSVIEKHVEAFEEYSEEKISSLKTALWNAELKIALQTEDYDILMEEKTKLQEKLISIQENILEKEMELKSAVLIKNEHLNCLKSIEDLKSTQENVHQENNQLQEQISYLTGRLSEVESVNAEQEILKKQKSVLLMELKTAQNRLQEKELEVANATLIVNEHVSCTENIKKLMDAEECLTQENCQLQKQIFDLQTDLSKADSKIACQIEKCNIHLVEKSNLLNELKTVQNELYDKEIALKNAILIESEHRNCLKNIENLTNVKEILTGENMQLQEQISVLKNMLSETESNTKVQKENYNNLMDEKSKVLEDLKKIQDNLLEKDTELENCILKGSEHMNCIEKLTQESYDLQAQISSTSQDLQIAKGRLSFLDNKFKTILLKCKDVLFSIKDLGKQKDKISLDLINIVSDYGLIENKVASDRQEMEDMCDLVLHCVKLMQDYILNQSLALEIPSQITEIGNQYFAMKAAETCNNFVGLHCDENVSQLSPDCQNLQTNMAKDLSAFSSDVYTLLCSFEERILDQKENFKFLVHHQLIEGADFKKMLVTLKFMKKIYDKICHRKSALQGIRDFKLCLFSQNQSSNEMASIIDLFSCDFKEDSDVTLFFEKCLVVDAYKNIYMTCKLKKMLCLVRDQLNTNFDRFEMHESYFNTYQDIHSHLSHVPVLTQSKYIIYLQSLACFCFKEKSSSEISCLTKNRELFCINSIVSDVKISVFPLILNCLIELSEKSCSLLFFKNLVYFIVKMLQSCCLKGVPLLSCDTFRIFEHFLLLISHGNASYFKIVAGKRQMSTLRDLLCSLLEDLSNIKQLVCADEQELQNNRNMLSEMSDQINKLKFDYENKHKDLNSLQVLLQEEKDKQQNLAILTEKTKNDFDTLLLQKEKWEKTILEMSKLCSVLKNIFSDSCDVLNLQSEIATLSDTFCLCQTCLTDVEGSEVKESNHASFTPVTLIHFIAELFNSKSDLEKEIMELEECKSITRQEIMELEGNKSLLQQTIDDIEGNVNTLEHELVNLKSKYSCLEKEYQNINSLYIESNVIREDQQNRLKANIEDIHNCKIQYEELFSEYQKVKNDLAEKEEEISNYQKNIRDKISKYEVLDLKCQNYEDEIENLNITITKLTDSEKKKTEKINNSLIAELRNKIASLEKSNNMLNMTVESVEQELQNIYEEKQNIQQKLQEKLDEVENLQCNITSWKDKVTEEKNEVSHLEHTILELRKEIEDAETKSSELLNKNSKLQSDVTVLEQTIMNYRIHLTEKDSCIQENNTAISQLKAEMSVIINEKKNLEMNVIEIEDKLNSELQNKEALLYDLEKKLNLILNEKTDLEKQISCLLISEEEKKKILLEKENSELKCKELKEKIDLLRSKLENFELRVNTAEKEKEKAFECIQNLKFENEKYTKEFGKLKKELSFAKKTNIESSALIKELQKKPKDNLEACEKAYLVKENMSVEVHSHTECKSKETFPSLGPNVVKPEHDYKEYMTKIINLLISVIKDIEYGNDCDKTDLTSLLGNWESNIENPVSFISEIRPKLQTVLGFRELKKIELELCNLKNVICKFTDDVHQYYEYKDQNNKCNVTPLNNRSSFEESLFVSPAADQTYFVLNSCIGDLKNSFEMLESYFSSMKNIISYKDLEIRSLKEQGLVTDERKTQDAKKDDDDLARKKIKLLLYNARRQEKSYDMLRKTNEELETRIKVLEQEKLELNAEEKNIVKDFNMLKKTNEELEARIKVLEQENLELNAEADEMAEIIKKEQNAPEELTELYNELLESSKELQKVKEKNECLTVMLEQYQEVFVKHGINIAAAEDVTPNSDP